MSVVKIGAMKPYFAFDIKRIMSLFSVFFVRIE